MHVGGGCVAGCAGVDDEDPAAGPGEHEGGGESGGASADDGDVVLAFMSSACRAAGDLGTLPFSGKGSQMSGWTRQGRVRGSTPAIAAALEVGARLKRLRTQRRLTLTGVAATTGISKSTLSRLETGQRRPTLELLLALPRLPGAVGCPGRGAGGGRPPCPSQAGAGEGSDGAAADPATGRHAGLEDRHPCQQGDAGAACARRLRVDLRPVRARAARAGRGGPGCWRRGRSPSSTPRCRTGSAAPARNRPRSSASSAGPGEHMHVRTSPTS